jgi:hypothetical protein
VRPSAGKVAVREGVAVILRLVNVGDVIVGEVANTTSLDPVVPFVRSDAARFWLLPRATVCPAIVRESGEIGSW